MPAVARADIQQQHLLQMSIIIQTCNKELDEFQTKQHNNKSNEAILRKMSQGAHILLSLLCWPHPVQFIMVTHCLHNDSYSF